MAAPSEASALTRRWSSTRAASTSLVDAATVGEFTAAVAAASAAVTPAAISEADLAVPACEVEFDQCPSVDHAPNETTTTKVPAATISPTAQASRPTASPSP